MLNQVILGGRLVNHTLLDNDFHLAKMKVDKNYYYIYWQGDMVNIDVAFEFKNKKYVVVRGKLDNITLEVPNRKRTNFVAVEVRSVEIYDF